VLGHTRRANRQALAKYTAEGKFVAFDGDVNEEGKLRLERTNPCGQRSVDTVALFLGKKW
jgi:hypothetical protein